MYLYRGVFDAVQGHADTRATQLYNRSVRQVRSVEIERVTSAKQVERIFAELIARAPYARQTRSDSAMTQQRSDVGHKVGAQHLARGAFVYVRQSTNHEVRSSGEPATPV
jgi:hypothetical protein